MEMIKELFEVGGKGFMVPAVLFLLFTYAVKGLFGLQSRRGQHRKEFLDLWNSSRSQDDLWLEVAIRHLCGTYLPAHVIRQVMTWPERGQALLDLGELWSLLRIDPESGAVAWINAKYASDKRRKVGRWLAVLGYFGCATIVVLSGIAASKSEPMTFSAWVYGGNAVLFTMLAFICLMHGDTMKKAQEVGARWVALLNKGNVAVHERDGANVEGSSAASAAGVAMQLPAASQLLLVP